MTRRLMMTMLTALVMVGLVHGTAFAHPGHDHKILGTVTMAAADHVMLKDTAGKAVTVYLNKDTKITRDKKPVTVADLQAGTRVAITATVEDVKGGEKATAKIIELGVAEPAK